MRVHLASVSHRHGTNVYAGGSRAELIEKLARYCRDHDHHKMIVSFEDQSEEGIVEGYFQPEMYGSQEFVEFDGDDVLADVTTLVKLLADTWQVDHVNGGMDDLHEKAQRLTSEDYEGAARAQGWVPHDTHQGFMIGKGLDHVVDPESDDENYDNIHCNTWEDLCGDEGIEPLPRATHFYSISKELADTLADDQRVMRDFAGMTIWARVEG